MPHLSYDEHETELELGDVLLMYTDGVTEAINASEQQFTVERLAELVKDNAHLSATKMVEAIKQAVLSFAGDGAQFDDLTMIAIKRIP
jgi:sigma-B regulation protein RsbU (phosphoserine phosphatase)